nr:hypothetical protein [Lachnoclostridium phocaeense]
MEEQSIIQNRERAKVLHGLSMREVAERREAGEGESGQQQITKSRGNLPGWRGKREEAGLK